MPTTPSFGFPYPSAVGVAPDVPYWLQQLAEAIEDQLSEVGRFASGETAHTVANLAAGAAVTVGVTFPAGRFSSAPDVTATLTGAAGGTNYLVARTSNITATGCNVILYNLGSTAIGAGVSAQTVKWVARLG